MDEVVNNKILNVMSLLTKLKCLPVLSKTWQLVFNERFFTTLNESCLCMMCFLMLLCPLLFSLFLVMPAHAPSRDEWQSKRRAYISSFYVHGTPPPSCSIKPSNRGKISPSHISHCQSKPCSHTKPELAVKE
jgi:hypothetical protein